MNMSGGKWIWMVERECEWQKMNINSGKNEYESQINNKSSVQHLKVIMQLLQRKFWWWACIRWKSIGKMFRKIRKIVEKLKEKIENCQPSLLPTLIMTVLSHNPRWRLLWLNMGISHQNMTCADVKMALHQLDHPKSDVWALDGQNSWYGGMVQ